SITTRSTRRAAWKCRSSRLPAPIRRRVACSSCWVCRSNARTILRSPLWRRPRRGGVTTANDRDSSEIRAERQPILGLNLTLEARFGKEINDRQGAASAALQGSGTQSLSSLRSAARVHPPLHAVPHLFPPIGPGRGDPRCDQGELVSP